MQRCVANSLLLLLCIATAALAFAAVSAQVVPDRFMRDIAQAEPASAGESGEGGGAFSEGQEKGGSPEREARRNQKHYWIFVHATLMSIAWVGLLPLGILLAQSRWTKPLRKPALGKKVWFWTHMAINIAGVALVIAAYAIATSDSTHMEIKKDDGSVAYAHKIVGTIAFALLLLQVVAAFIRPHPHVALRGIWNFAHHNLGRLVILVAWSAIWLGVTIGYEDVGGLARWAAPLAAAQGVILILYLLNQGLKKRKFREEKVEEDWKAKQAERNGSDHVVVGAPAGSTESGSFGNGHNGQNVYVTSIRPAAGVQSV